jgi:hypothetical protein
METINSILIPYFFFGLFSSFIIEHYTNYKGASKVFLRLLAVVGVIIIIGFLTILFTVGYKENWWIPILLGIGGFIICSLAEQFILNLIGHKNLFIMSLLGVIIVPVSLYIILDRILF